MRDRLFSLLFICKNGICVFTAKGRLSVAEAQVVIKDLKGLLEYLPETILHEEKTTRSSSQAEPLNGSSPQADSPNGSSTQAEPSNGSQNVSEMFVYRSITRY